MMMLLRKHAVLWAGAGVLGIAGAATSFAATEFGSPSPEEPPPAPAENQVMEQEAAPQAEGEPRDESQEQDPPAEDPRAQTDAVLGVPEDSPACENVGCGEVENAGGLTLHLPQPAVDGMNKAAENRDAARNKSQEEVTGETGGDEAVTDADEEPTEDTVRGVPEDSPACENVGCGEVTNAGGVTLHLPQPAVDGINRARDHREAAQDKGQGADASDEPGATSAAKPGGRPDHAGPPDRAGKR